MKTLLMFCILAEIQIQYKHTAVESFASVLFQIQPLS